MNVQMIVAACAISLALPLGAATATRAAKKTAIERSAWPPETVSGTIQMVEPDRHLMVVEANGVPFDIRITPNTRIHSGNRMVSLQNLAQDANQNVSVTFIPERSGDVARSIRM